MEPLTFYWILTLVVLLSLIILTDVDICTICSAVSVVLVAIYMAHASDTQETTSAFTPYEEPINGVWDTPAPVPENESKQHSIVDDIIGDTADDRIYKALANNALKDKNAKTIRAGWNNNSVKKYFTDEFVEEGRRDWWTEDDDQLSKKHNITF